MNTTKFSTISIPIPVFYGKTRKLVPDIRWVLRFQPSNAKDHVFMTQMNHLPRIQTFVPAVASDVHSGLSKQGTEQEKLEKIEINIEKVIYGCRFFAILAVWGSLIGSFLCFFKGCTHVFASFQDYFVDRAKVIGSLVEATDVYLLGTVMLVFGMGLYELFISNFDKAKSMSDGRLAYTSSLFGLFTLKERPKWLEIKSVNELKTKLGHVIVMLLLICLFDKSKKASINTPLDLLCFAASVLLSSGCLFLLSKLS